MELCVSNLLHPAIALQDFQNTRQQKKLKNNVMKQVCEKY